MNKFTILALSVIFFSASLFAKKVDQETIKTVGKNFFFERLGQYREVNYRQLSVKDIIPVEYNQNTAYYILNFNSGGFVIVAADDAVTPVLGYSFDGNYTTENHPPQFDSWMGNYAKEIDYCIQENLQADKKITEEWRSLMSGNLRKEVLPDVQPMLISTWDQGSNYNALCPEDPAGPDGKVYAGCVATAMAQIMYYYRFPAIGSGSHCYYPWGYPQQCADFGNTSYQWNEMLNSINFKDTAVAELIWHCGISVEMMYSPGGSGAYSEDALTAFKNNFRYSQGVHLVRRDDYSPTGDEFPAILRGNLDTGRPMYYDGYGPGGGHAFNVDGYQGTNYFHFNWGWSGYYNGYYYLSNLNPGGTTFNAGQKAMVDLYPDTLQNIYPAYCSGQTVLTSLFGTVEDGSGPKNYQNNSNASWLIHPQSVSDSVISVTISFNRLKTETGNDLVRIYQGSSPTDPLIGSYSGNSVPPQITISGNKVLITFTTNGSVTGEGWFISYSSEVMNWCSGTTYLTEPQGSFTDGSLEFNYRNNNNCRWIIDPEEGGAIHLSFTAFSTEGENDIVKIIDLETGDLLANYSGNFSASNLPPPVTSTGNKMMILFLTNNNLTDKGWSADYFTFPVGTDEQGTVSLIEIFPNPASDFIQLKTCYEKPESLYYELLGMDGKVLISSVVTTGAGKSLTRIALSDVSEGIYFLKLADEKSITTKKVIIQ